MTKTVKDNLEDHLAPYRDEDIQKNREEKIQLVTVIEFKQLHKEKLECENKLNKAVEALISIKLNGLFKRAGAHGDYAPYDVDTQAELAEKVLAEIGAENE